MSTMNDRGRGEAPLKMTDLGNLRRREFPEREDIVGPWLRQGESAMLWAPVGLGKSMLDQKRLEIELGPEGDHDVPYSFALPVSMPQVLIWMRLLARVQRGELVP